MLDHLLKNVDIQDSDYLLYAVKSGELNVIKYLTEDKKVNINYPHGLPPLVDAISLWKFNSLSINPENNQKPQRYFKIIQYLINKRANVNLPKDRIADRPIFQIMSVNGRNMR